MSPILLELIVLGLGLGLLLVESFAERLNRNTIAIIGIVGLACVFLLLQFGSFPSTTVAGYTQDKAALFFKKFALVTTIIVLIMSIDYSDTIRKFVRGLSPGSGIGEFYSLPILTCAGMMWMASANDFVLIFISLELVTVSFYTLVAFTRRNPASLEAGAKYLILGALSTGFFVYGITWIYGVTQNTNLASIAKVLPSIPASDQTGLLFGAILVLVGLGFKVAAAPFQFWVPDVYQGAPTPITAFLSVGSKASGFIVLLRVLETFQSVRAVEEKLSFAIVLLAAGTLNLWKSGCSPPNQLQAAASVFQHRACRLPFDGGCQLRRVRCRASRRRLSGCLFADDAALVHHLDYCRQKFRGRRYHAF